MHAQAMFLITVITNYYWKFFNGNREYFLVTRYVNKGDVNKVDARPLEIQEHNWFAHRRTERIKRGEKREDGDQQKRA